MKSIVQRVIQFLEKAGIVITDAEKDRIEIADFGLNDFKHTGLVLLTYVNTERCCAKELILFPNQTCPEHLHPPIDGRNGKEETFRCRRGNVYLFVEGEETSIRMVDPPDGNFTVFHQIELNPGEQYTIFPNTKHWFKAGSEGAIISEFSTKSRDDVDVFTDARIIR